MVLASQATCTLKHLLLLRKNTPYCDSLSAEFQGSLMHLFIPKNGTAATSGDTSALRKQTIAGAEGQNKVYDVIRHSMRRHCEKLSSLVTAGLCVVISLSNRYYNATTVWFQGFKCLDNCTNFFDNCVFCMLQSCESGLSQFSSVRRWLHVDYYSCK
jgi:hypothetical protein